MGVHGLWDLLAPVGRRVSVETLSGKKLAIDASIWMVQFMKAMRDEKGEMVRNAHLLGFFRRICKLLYLRTKPVFVFDGGTPSLKRRTVIARRRQRENAQAKIRKTAEKLLLNQLKSMRLKELAIDIENQRKMNKSDARHKASNVDKVVSDQPCIPMTNSERDGVISEGYQNKNVGEMEIGNSKNNMSASNEVFSSIVEEECEEEEELILESSNQYDKCKKKAKGKEVPADEADIGSHSLEGDDVVSNSCDQEKLDEMLAASLAAQENGSLFNTPSTSTAPVSFGEESGDEDEEMILPLHGKVDPSILAALPPSVQLDLLVQMRERLMAENRQRYQKVKKAPEKFSELQIQAYLKTVAFRREIDEVQKAASGKVVDGVQTSRIASEANREFIFSSSFSGDKQSLAASGVQRNEDKQWQRPNGQLPLKPTDNTPSFSKVNSGKELTPDESGSGFHDGIETFLDERGRTRVSRVRAMGMRMTRDLQRNLDLMKEIEGEQTHATKSATEDFPIENRPVKSSQDKNVEFVTDGQPLLSNDTSVQISFEIDDSRCIDSDDDIFTRLALGDSIGLSSAGNNVAKSQISGSASDSDWEEGIVGEPTHATKSATEDFPIENRPVKSSQDKNVEVVTDGQPMLLSNDTSVQISFEVDNSRCIDRDDDIFTRLAFGDSIDLSSVGNNVAKSLISCSASDSDWEEGIVNGNGDGSLGNVVDLNPSLEASNISKDSALQWGEGVCDDPKSFVYKAEFGKPVSKGYMEEEADLQEAIRRSLNDLVGVQVKASGAETSSDSARFLDQGNTSKLDVSGDNYVQHRQLSDTSDVEKLDDVGGIDKKGMPMSRLLKRDSDFGALQAIQDATIQGENRDSELLPTKSVTLLGEESTPLVAEHCSSSLTNDRGKFTLSSEFSGPLSSGILLSKMVDDQSIDNETMPEFSPHSVKMREPSLSFTEPSSNSFRNNDVKDGLAEEENFNKELDEREHYMDKSAVTSSENVQANSVGADLEEEMQFLDKEYRSLGEEQRKLERNADSVSGEMFTECQELLQIFGLPYIIAPMEAEAQCAYMELANLVDGVVTDDSDAFLFGARDVYKNIFDDRKYVETYFMKDIEKELGLTREKLIRMALLLGSDYTEGVSGIGIVNAIEVVNAFPEEDGLHKFREWIESPDPTILGALGAPDGPRSRERGPKFDGGKGTKKNVEETHTQGNDISDICQEEKFSADMPEIKQIFMDKHRNVSKNWHIPSSFPSEAVISAYLCPQVDKSTEPFSWGKPDLHVLHRLCWEKFGWGMQKSNDLLQPVLKEYNKHETQLRLEAFYTFNERFAKIRSKRIKKAVKGITGNLSKVLVDDVVEEASEPRKRRKVGCGQSLDGESEEPSQIIKETVIGVKSSACEKSTSKKRTSQARISADKGKKELQANTGPIPYNRSRGGKRVGDSGGGRGTGRGKGKKRTSSEQSDCSSDDVGGGNCSEEVYIDSSDLQGRRRSTRLRKPACYVENDLEIYDADKSVEKGISDEEVAEPELSCLPRASKSSHIGLSKNDKHEVDDLSFENSFEDRMENQGGFCPNEGEVGHTGLRENLSPMEADVSKDYLKMGGGFCVEETEAEKDDTCSPQTDAVSNGCPSGFIEEVHDEAGTILCTSSVKGALNELQQDGGHISCSKTEKSSEFVDVAHVADSSKVCVSLPESNENTLETPSFGGLRAMPSLKRKRRKS